MTFNNQPLEARKLQCHLFNFRWKLFHLGILYPDQPNYQPGVRIGKKKKKKDIFSNTDISKSSPAQTLFLESYWGMHSTKTKVSTEKEEGMDPETTGSKHRKKAGGNRSIPTKWDLKPTPCSRSGEPQCRLEQRTWSPPIFPVKKKNRSITWCVWT